jgi:hypothetical protein
MAVSWHLPQPEVLLLNALQKMHWGWQNGSSYRVWGPEVKPQYHQKEKDYTKESFWFTGMRGVCVHVCVRTGK